MFSFDRPRRRKNWVFPAFLLVGIGAVFLFCCSGLHFPFWNAQNKLEGRLQADVGVGLPAGARVVEAVWVAGRDPGEYYAVEIPVDQVARFILSIRKFGREVRDLDPTRRWTMGEAPDWWNTGSLPAMRAIGVSVERGQGNDRHAIGGLQIFYSLTASRAYIFWYRV